MSQIVVLAAILTSCGDNNRPDVSVDPGRVQVPVGVTTDVQVTLSGPSASQDDMPTWSVANSSIATAVFHDGHLSVTGVAVGTTQAIGSFHDTETTVDVVVTDAQLVGLALSTASLALPVGLEGPLTVAARYTDGTTVDITSQVTWSLDDPTLATFHGRVLHAMRMGSTLGHASFAGVTTTFMVTVTSAVLTAIAVNPVSARLAPGIAVELTATGMMSDGQVLDVTRMVTWSSADPTVATVSSTGRALAVKTGATDITAAIDEIAGASHITVTGAHVTGLTVSPTGPTLPRGSNQQLHATATLDDGTTADVTTQVTWQSSQPSIATVDGHGLVHGAAIGDALIQANLGAQAASTTVHVASTTLLRLEVTPSPTTVAMLTLRQLIATGVYSDGTVVDLTSQAVWASDHSLNATVANGQVFGVLPGPVTITASFGGQTGSATVTVTAATLVSITVSSPSTTLPLGTTAQLTAIASFSDGTSQDVTATATWTSDHTDLITVSNAAPRGLATAAGTGAATITATLNGTSGALGLTATAAILSRIDLTPATLTLPAGTSHVVIANGTYSDGTTVDLTAQATWSSSAPAIAAVSNDATTKGKVTGVTAGDATITASVGATTATVTIHVTSALLIALQVSPPALDLPLGTSAPLTATATYSDGTTIDATATATWSSSAAVVASVSNAAGSHGVVTSHLPGTATITATLDGQSATSVATVTLALLTQIQLTPATLSLPAGATGAITATGVYTDGTTHDITGQVSWTSSGPAIATVAGGTVTALAPGTVTITASSGPISATASVTVGNAALATITIDPPQATLPLLQSLPLRAIGSYGDGSTLDITQQVTWVSSNPLVASVSNAAAARGQVTGLVPGTATITAAVGLTTATATVTVTSATLTAIQVSPATLGLAAGTTGALTAVGVYSDGSHQDLTAVATWTSSAPAAAAVSNVAGSAGVVTAIAVGSATITATLGATPGATPGATSGTAAVTVTSAVLSGLAIDPPNPVVPLLQSIQLTAIGMYSDGSAQDVTQQATWTSSNPLVASVSNLAGLHGRVLGLLAGTTTITATLGGIATTATVTVTPAVLVSAQISPAAVTLPSGLSAPLEVIGTYSDGTTADITAQATFSSTNPVVASVSSGGLVTAGAPGTATVTASAGTVSASVVVNSVAATLQQLQVTPTTLSLPRGTTAQLSAVGIYSDGSHVDVTTQATWTSGAPATASVGNLLTAGKVIATAAGSTTITATLGALHTDVPVTVTAAVLGTLAIDPPAPTVFVAQTVQLTATGLYSDTSTLDITQQATWTSSNPLIAAVSNVAGQRGKVTGLVPGTATISATLDGVTTSVAITSSPATLVTMQVTPAVLVLPSGLSSQLAISGLYSDGSSHDVTSQVTFATTSAPVATVSATGAVTARGFGVAAIIATLGAVTATVPVTVSPAVLQQLQIAPASLALARGTTGQLMATGVYSDGSHADLTSQVTWTSSSTAVASVSNVLLSNGRVTASAVGDATITAAMGAVTATAAVHVGAATLSTISVVGNAGPVPLGLTTQLTALATYSDGTTADVTAQATWTSTGSAVVVSNAAAWHGLVTAVALGQATVSATAGTVTGSLEINTTGAQLRSIDIPAVPAVPLGLTTQLTATGHYSDGSAVDVSSQVAWSSTNPAIGAVSATGVVTALGLGTTSVQASLDGVTASQQIAISAAVLQVLVVAPPAAALAAGLTQALTATGTFSDGSLIDLTAQVTWTSDHPERASVTNAGTHGVVTAVASGTATITAQQGSVTGHAAVVVTPVVLQTLTVSGVPGGIALGQIAPLTATAHYSDGSTANVTSQVAWTSSAPASIAVSNLPGSQGSATAIGPGSATLTATGLGATGSLAVTVGSGCHVVINELKTGALLSVSDELIELFNPCTFAVDLSHEKLVYRTIAGVVDINLVNLAGSLPAGGYRVYGGSAYGGPVSGSFSTDLPALGGGIAVRDANVIYDALGYGIAVNLFVEGAVSLQIPLGQALARIPNGTDTNNNAADFQIRTPTPGAPNL